MDSLNLNCLKQYPTTKYLNLWKIPKKLPVNFPVSFMLSEINVWAGKSNFPS